MNIPQENNFYVIQFLNLPHTTVPQIVFVPNSWIRTRSPSDGTVCVSYPIEQHIATEGRILSGETYRQEWKLFMAKMQAGFDTIEEARHFISNQSQSSQSRTEGSQDDEETSDEDDSTPNNHMTEDPDLLRLLRNTKMQYLADRGSKRRKQMIAHAGSSFQGGGSLVSSAPPFFEQRVGHLPKRRLSMIPSTSSQAMTEIPDSSFDKKMRLKRDLKNLSRGFSTVIDQFEDMFNVMNRVQSSLADMSQVFSCAVSNLNDIIDLGDDIQTKGNNDVNVPKHLPGVVKPPTVIPKVERSQVPSFVRNPHDSKWTLRYREKVPGVVELMPNSGVYLSEFGLQQALKTATDSKTLARMLMKEIFSDYALSVCSLAGGKGGVSDRVRPGLDSKARAFLLEFVTQYSNDKKWDASEHSILMSLRNKLLEMRRNQRVAL